MSEPEIKFQLDVPIGAEWQHIDLMRTSLLNCLGSVFHSSHFCHAVSMVGAELLENAVKYGEWKAGVPSLFRMRIVGSDERVTIEVSNPVPDGSKDVTRLLDGIDKLKKMPSAAAAYTAKLREMADATSLSGTSALGLVRIAYEGNCTLEAMVKNNVLTVRATCIP